MVTKQTLAGQLETALRSLAVHKPYFTTQVGEILFAKFLSSESGTKPAVASGKLTAREREIARLLAEGSSNKETATILGISVRTAETHRATLMRKLALDDLPALVRYAIRNRIIEA